MFLDNIDRLKSKLHQYKFLDYDMYREEFDKFSANNEYCKKKKVAITDVQMISVFSLVDIDESGELEPEEIMDVFMDRKQLGQSRDEQAKQDAIAIFWKNFNSLKAYMYEVLDLD